MYFPDIPRHDVVYTHTVVESGGCSCWARALILIYKIWQYFLGGEYIAPSHLLGLERKSKRSLSARPTLHLLGFGVMAILLVQQWNLTNDFSADRPGLTRLPDFNSKL